MAAIGSALLERESGCMRYTPQIVVACCVALAALATLTVALSSWANVKIACMCMHGSEGIISSSPYTILLPSTLIALCAIAVRVLWVDEISAAPKEQMTAPAVEVVSSSAATKSTPALFVPIEIIQSPFFYGKCSSLLVQVGDVVTRDTPICVLEAMKMETTIYAEEAGTIAELPIQAGTMIKQGDRLYTILPDRREFPDP